MPTRRVSPTKRTLDRARKQGFHADVVERWIGPTGNPRLRKRRDLFGFIDIVALDGQPGLLGIQATTNVNAASRVLKIRIDCYELARTWLEAGNRIQVWGWAKKGARGVRKTWQVRIVDLQLGEFQGEPTIKPGEGLAAFAKDVAKQKRKRKRAKRTGQLGLALEGP